MSRRSFPSIEPADLRDHADEARVERVWERLDHDLASRAPFADARRRRSPLATLAIAAAIGAFGAGLLLGKVTWDRRQLPLAPLASPVVEKSLVEVLAAGTQQRTFPLQGGGRLTLSPQATVEVERSGGAITLSLLQGEASVDSAGRALTIVAGDARINTQSGSVLSVRRNADDLDVKVDRGSVSVSSPTGPNQLAKNQRATVPLHTAVSAVRNDAVDARRERDRALPPRPRKSPQASLAKLANVPEWFTHYPGDGDRALALLRKQGVDKAIDQAHSAAELNAIAELMSGRDQAAELRGWERLVRDFPSDQRAFLAARDLGRIYEASGDLTRAKEFKDKVEPLAKNATTGSDALFCDLIRRETDKTKAALMAKEYLDKYPDGECRDEFEQQVQAEAPVTPGDASKPAATPGDTSKPAVPPQAPPPSPKPRPRGRRRRPPPAAARRPPRLVPLLPLLPPLPSRRHRSPSPSPCSTQRTPSRSGSPSRPTRPRPSPSRGSAV